MIQSPLYCCLTQINIETFVRKICSQSTLSIYILKILVFPYPMNWFFKFFTSMFSLWVVLYFDIMHVSYWIYCCVYIFNSVIFFRGYWILKILCLQYFYNTFTTNFKWQVIIGCYWWGKKGNFSSRFKLELITTIYL